MVREALPSFYLTEYPKFVEFLETYMEFMADSEGFDDLLGKLTDVRDIQLADPELVSALRLEYGADFPNLSTIDDSTIIRLFEYWYRSKGTKEGVEAYFRLFLNSEAEMVLPRDNMLRCSDGVWDEDLEVFTETTGHLSEATMVIQDSYYYQIFSYLIRSEISIVDWGTIFEKLAHPAGWIFFGEVQITETAAFSALTFSPTIQPGLQTRDANLLVLATVAMAMGASAQQLRKILGAKAFADPYSFQDVNINLFTSTYTIGAWVDEPIQTFVDNLASQRTSIRAPARIIITSA